MPWRFGMVRFVRGVVTVAMKWTVHEISDYNYIDGGRL